MPERVVVRGEEVEVLIELGEGPVPEELFRRLPQESGSGSVGVVELS